ncbi:MAG: hypothetical protein JJT96_03115 [Opitutales bacterium]|nr:hypothetical protein [Opitutales bacterium]
MRTLFKSLSLLLLGSLAGSTLTAQTTATGPGYLDSWNWQAPTPADAANLIGIAANGSTVLAVGEDGQVQRSTDGGDSWTIVSDPLFVGTTFSGIANSGATFVIVGSGGSALRSSDNGLTWTTVDADTTEDLLDLAFDGLSATWIAVGANGTIRRSVDGGLTWSSVANPSTRDLRAVAAFGGNFYAGGEAGTLIRFAPGAASASILQGGSGGFTYDIRDFASDGDHLFAVGTNGHILRSANGSNWSVVYSNSAYDLHSISHHPFGFFLAAGEDGRFLYSLNGTNWLEGSNRTPFATNALLPVLDGFLAAGSQHSVFSVQPRDVADANLSMEGLFWTQINSSDGGSAYQGAVHADGSFVVVGENGNIRLSTDGSLWSEPTMPAPLAGANWRSVVYGGGRFVAVGDSGVVAHADSAMPNTWTEGSLAAGATPDLHGAAFGNGRFVAIGSGANVYISDDLGATWSPVLVGALPSSNLRGVAHGNGRFVVVGEGGLVLTSENGLSWTPRFTPIDADLTDVLHGPHGFVAVGAGGTIIKSEFGATWQKQIAGSGISAAEIDLEAITYADGIYVAVGSGRSILTSLDAVAWTAQEVLTRNRFFAVAGGGGVFIVAGDFGSILSSSSPLPSDLDRWSLRRPGETGPNLNDVLFANGVYVIGGANGGLWTSLDGENWTPRNSNTSNDITGIAYGNGRWVAVAGRDRLVSTDGLNWNATQTWSHNMLRVKFANGVFVTVGEESEIYSSPDGLVWNGGIWRGDAGSGPANINSAVFFEPLMRWVAVGEQLPGTVNQVYYSDDNARSWTLGDTSTTNTGDNLRAVYIDPDVFGTPVLFAIGGTNFYSFDGISWDPIGGYPHALDATFGDGAGFPTGVIVGEGGAITLFPSFDNAYPGIFDDLNAVTYANGQFIAVGDNGRILTSPQGKFWQVRGVQTIPAILSVVRGASAYVAVGEDGRIYRSSTGLNWEPKPPPADVGAVTMRHVFWTGSQFVAAGDLGNIWTSSNGEVWTRRTWNGLSHLRGGASSGSHSVLVGEGGRILRAGSGLIDWQPRSSGTSVRLHGAIYDSFNSQYVVVGDQGTVLTSPDGMDWTTIPSLDNLPLRDLAQTSDGLLVAVGEEGRIFTSMDGVNWTPSPSSGTIKNLRTVSFGDGILVAMGDRGLVISSSNQGATWFSRPSNTAYTLYGSAFFEGVFVGVGGFGTIIHSGTIFEKQSQSILFPEIGEQTLAASPLQLSAFASSGLPVGFRVISGPAVVSGNQLTLTGEGTVLVRAEQPGNRFFLSAPAITRSFQVVDSIRLPQTILFDGIEDQSFGVSVNLNDLATATSGLPLSFELLSGPALLVEGVLSTGFEEGTVLVRVSQNGNQEFAPAAPLEISFGVRAKEDQIVVIQPFAPPSLGDPAITLRAVASSGLTDFRFEVISGPAFVSGNSLAVYGVGVVTIEAVQPGDSEFNRGVGRTSFSVGGSENFEPGPSFLDLWTWRSPEIVDSGYNALASDGAWTIAVGDDGRIARSSNGGLTWSSVDSGTTEDLYDIVFVAASNRFVALGDNGLVLVSLTEGTTWTQSSVSGNPSLRGLAVNREGNRFVAVGLGGRIFSSPDALNWVDATPPGFSRDLADVVWVPGLGDGRFVAVGATGAVLRSSDSAGASFEVLREGLGFNLHAVHAPSSPFGAWRVFAVGDDGIVMASKDGVIWSNRFSGSSYQLRAIHSGNGFLLAAGENGRVLYSQNGDVWTESFTRFNVGIRGLTFINGLFLAGGDNYSIFSTPQGLTWTIRETTTRTTYHDSAANADGTVRIVVGDNGRIVRSVDGVNWDPAVSVPVTENLRGATFGFGRFYAVGQNGTILHSSDGDTWTTVPAVTTRHLNSIAFANGRLVAVGDGFTTLLSIDGDAWTSITSGSSNNLHAVAFGNGTWTAVGSDGLIITSLNGETWRTQFSGTTRGLNSVTFGDGRFVAVGQGGSIFTSTFGDVWTLRASGTTFDLHGVALADGVYVAVGQGFTFLTSRDGVDWSAQKSGTLNSLRNVSYAGELFVAVGDFETILTATAVLPPGLDQWTLRNPLPEGPNLNEIIYGNGIYVAVGGQGTILVSTDGLNWSERDSGISDPITGVAFGNGRFVAVGGQNILVSEDTLNWRVQTTWLVPLYKVSFGGNIFVAVGASSHILHSADGLIWAGGQQNQDGQDINDVRYEPSKNRFVAVGAAAEKTATYVWLDPDLIHSPFERLEFVYERELVTQVYISPNGIDWERVHPPLRITPTRLILTPVGYVPDPRPRWYDETLNTVAFGRGYFLAAGDGLMINSFTADNDEWSVVSLGGRSIRGSDFGEGQGRSRFVHVGVNGSISSHDPQSISFPGIQENLNSVVWGGDQFVAVGDNSRILTSPTGQFWQVRSTQVLPAFRSVTSRPGEYVAVGERGLIYRSTDSINWEAIASPSLLNLNSVITSAARYIAVGNSGVILTSGNSQDWSLRVSGVLDNLNQVTRSAGGVIVAVGNAGQVTRSSDESISLWTPVATGVTENLTAVVHNPVLDTFFAFGVNGRLLTSIDDGLSWTASVVPNFGTLPIHDVYVFGDGRMVAVGEQGRVFTSPDGLAWTRRFSGTTNALHSIVFGDNLLFATGAAGTALSSSDGGLSWFRRHTNTGYTLYGCDFRDGAFLAVGGFSTIITSGAVESKFDQSIQFVPISPKVITDSDFAVFAQATSGLPIEFEIVSGPATVIGNIVSLTGSVGDVVIRALQNGNANFRPADPVEQIFRVTLANQVITFNPLPDRTFGDEPFTLTATTSAPGLDVVFGVESGPAVLDGNLLRITGTGTVTVVASQPGTDQFNAATPVSRSFQVGPAAQTIDFSLPPSATLGDPPILLTAEASSDLPVSFRVVSGPASISGGNLILDGVGTVVVEATQAGNELYLAAAAVRSEIAVAPALPGNFWRPVTLPAAVAQTDFRDVIWSGQDGRFVAVGSGQAVITSSTGLNWSRRSSNGSAELTSVSRGFDGFLASSASGMRLRSPDGLNWAALSDALVAPVSDMAYGNGLFVAVGAEGFIATAPIGRAAEDWTLRTSAASGLLTSVIFSNGEFLAAGDGVILRSADGRTWETVFNSPGDLFRDITRNGGNIVVVGEGGVAWFSTDNGDSWFLGVGVSGNLTAVTYGAGRFVAVGQGGVIYTSSNGSEWTPRVSNVVPDLRAIAFTEETFVIVGDNGTVLTTGDAQDNVLPKYPQSITFGAPADVSFDAGAVALSASADSGLPVSFGVSSGPAVLEADGTTLTLTGLGEVVVRASQSGDATFAPAAEVERRFTVTAGANVITFAALADATFGDGPVTLSASASSGLAVSFELVSGPAELDGDELTLTGAGTVTVRALQAGDAIYAEAAPVEQSFTVAPAPQTITFDAPATVTLGVAPLELEATASSGLPVSLALISGPAQLEGNVLTITGSGSVVVEATQAGDANWLVAPAVTRTITVTSVAVGEFWRPLEVPSVVAETDFRDVIWSGTDERFVAVGSGQAVITSGTGLSWVLRSTGAAELTSVTQGFGGYLASSSTGIRLRSTSGLAWGPLSNALVAPVSSMAYGNGLYVAVGAGGYVATSPNGLVAADWTVRSIGATGLLTSVIFAEGEFLAAGDGVLLRSSNGREWETVFNSPGDLFRGIARYGENVVAVGEDGVAWSSPDNGENWFLGLGATGDLAAVTYGAGLFVAVGQGGAIFTSPNGLEWTARISGVTADLRAIAFTENTFVVVGANGTVLTTGDTQENVLTKTAQTISFAELANISFAEGEKVLSATSTSGLPVRFGVSSGPAVLEADGVTLTLTGLGEVVVRASQSGDATFAPAAEVERRFTVTGIEQTINFATIPSKVFGDPPFQPVATVLPSGLPAQFEIVSGPAVIRDGLIEITGVGTVVVRAKQPGDATHMAAPAVEQSFVVARAPQVITFGVLSPMEEVDPPRTLVATSSSGLPVSFEIVSGPATISDGNRLTPTGVGQVTVRATQPGNQLYLPAAPRERTFEVRPSSTGSVWTPVPDRPVETDLVGVSFAGFRFFATGARSAILRANSDASDWTAVSTGSGVLNKVAFGNNVYVAVGEAGIVLQSPSGTSWNFFSSGVDVPMNDIVYGNGRFVAVGSGGAIFTSTSGTDWTLVQSGVSDDLRSVIYGGGRFVAVGGRGITVSMDGLNWTALETAEAAGFNAITYGGGRYLIVGDDFTVWTSSNTNSWTIGSQTGPDLFGVAYGGGRFIAVGSEGAIFTSASGLGGWLQRSSGTTANLRDVAYIEDKFVIVGDGGTILHDGVINIRSPQTITFGEIPDRGLMEGLLTLSPSASSGLPVTLTVISGPATFMVDGRTLIFASGGMVTVRASQEGNGDFLPAPEVTRTFSVRGPSDPTDFALLSNRDLLLGELSGNELEAAAVIIENTGRAAYIDSRMRSTGFLSVRRVLMVNAFMRGTWGGPQSMKRNKDTIDTFGLAFLVESLIPDFRRVYFENRAVPGIMAPASEVDPFLRAVWRAKYGAEAPEPTSAQLAPLREGFRSFPVEMFLSQVIQEVSGFDGRSMIFGIPNPPPNRLRDEADAAALIIGLMRLPASNAEVARLARQPLLAQIEQVLADERYFDRLALWAGSAEFSDDIRFSPWLGVHWVTGDGWTYSPELGWIYIFADDMMGLWIYSVDLGWMWTSPGYYSAGLYYRVNGGWSSR